MSTGDGYGHRWGRNSEFCVAVGSATRTAGSLTQSAEGADCSTSRSPGRLGLYASLIGFNPCGLKVPQRVWAPTQRILFGL